jgi:hypothetical protein
MPPRTIRQDGSPRANAGLNRPRGSGNAAEQVWNDFKRHTATSLLRDTRDLRRRLEANTRRVQRSQAKLRSFMLASKLPSPP